jgi:hypothetical protein
MKIKGQIKLIHRQNAPFYGLLMLHFKINLIKIKLLTMAIKEIGLKNGEDYN